MNNNQDKSFSLQEQIRKRKSQEITRTVETKLLDSIRGKGEQIPTKISVPTPESLQISQPESLPQQRRASNSPIQRKSPTLSFRQKRLIIGMAAGLAILLVCAFTLVVSLSGQQPARAAIEALPSLPLKDTLQVVDYLKAVGVNVSNVQELTAGDSWQANRLLQIEVTVDGKPGVFLLLSYDSQSKAVADTFRARGSKQYSKWMLRNLSNINVLASPKTPVEIQQMVFSHLTSYIVAPYRSFLPTPTPQPSTNTTP
jgi:hypothetical protein